MLETLANYFDTSHFMPHGHCFLWSPSLLWIYVVSDLAIAASYFSIPFALCYFAHRRPDVPFRWVFVMFGALVLACGTTHLISLWNIWHAEYWAEAGIKALTAGVSVATALLLWPLIPAALRIPSHALLDSANRKLQDEVARRTQADAALLEANNALERRVAERTGALERAGDALRESEARFRSLTEMSSDFYWESDAEHRLTMRGVANAKLKAVSTFERGTQLGERRWEVPYLSPDEAGWQAHRAQMDAHRPFRDFEFSRRGIDGLERHVSISGDPMFDAAGAFKGYRGVGTDITARKRADLAMRAAEEQYRILVEQSIAGAYIIQDGRFVYVNPRFLEIFGYGSADELIGREATKVVAEQDRAMVQEKIRQRIEMEVANDSYSLIGLRKDGAMIEVGLHGARAIHAGRSAIIGLVQDISEKRRAEEEIRSYVQQLKTAFMSTVGVATTLSEMRDPYTAGHERRVAEIAVAIGAELGLDERAREGLRVAGYLHDIGKITVPTEILSKPGKLSAIEFQLVQGHAKASYDVLKDVAFPWPVAKAALQHHERIDGSGYPQGLKGEAICAEARIIAVADVIEAMSSHRPYRPALGLEAALAEIERGRGSVYDAEIADACLRLFREDRYQLPT